MSPDSNIQTRGISLCTDMMMDSYVQMNLLSAAILMLHTHTITTAMIIKAIATTTIPIARNRFLPAARVAAALIQRVAALVRRLAAVLVAPGQPVRLARPDRRDLLALKV